MRVVQFAALKVSSKVVLVQFFCISVYFVSHFLLVVQNQILSPWGAVVGKCISGKLSHK